MLLWPNAQSVDNEKDQEILFDSEQDSEHYQALVSVIETELDEIPNDKLVKILAAIYKSLNRRTKGSREYLNFIHHFFKYPEIVCSSNSQALCRVLNT